MYGPYSLKWWKSDALAAGGVEDARAQAHDAAGRDLELEVHALVALHHVRHLAAARAEDLDDLAGELAGHVDDGLLDRLDLLAVLVRLDDDLRAADLELVAFSAHGLHEHREVQDASAGDLHAALVLGLDDVHRDVGLGLAQQALLDLAAADDLALLADERARGRREHDRHRRLFDVDRVEQDRLDAAREHVADVGVLDAHDRADVAGVDLCGLLAAHALEGEELLDVGLVAAAVVLDHQDALAVVQRAREDAADADAADEVRVVDGADLHRDRTVDVDVGRRDVVDDRVEQRDHVHVARRRARSARSR